MTKKLLCIHIISAFFLADLAFPGQFSVSDYNYLFEYTRDYSDYEGASILCNIVFGDQSVEDLNFHYNVDPDYYDFLASVLPYFTKESSKRLFEISYCSDTKRIQQISFLNKVKISLVNYMGQKLISDEPAGIVVINNHLHKGMVIKVDFGHHVYTIFKRENPILFQDFLNNILDSLFGCQELNLNIEYSRHDPEIGLIASISKIENRDAVQNIYSDGNVKYIRNGNFYLSKDYVMKPEWDEVRSWALNNGYVDLIEADCVQTEREVWLGHWTNYTIGVPAGVDYLLMPIIETVIDFTMLFGVNLFDCIKWLNAKSEMEGLVPVYRNADGSVFRTGEMGGRFYEDKMGYEYKEPLVVQGNGYRLLTEQEYIQSAQMLIDADVLEEDSYEWCWGIRESIDLWQNMASEPKPGCHRYIDLGVLRQGHDSFVNFHCYVINDPIDYNQVPPDWTGPTNGGYYTGRYLTIDFNSRSRNPCLTKAFRYYDIIAIPSLIPPGGIGADGSNTEDIALEEWDQIKRSHYNNVCSKEIMSTFRIAKSIF